MNSNQDSLHTLTEIRDLMERSSKFLSLSGLSGVFAGIFALMGAGAAFVRFKTDWLEGIQSPVSMSLGDSRQDAILFLLADGLLVLTLSLVVCVVLTVRKGRKKGLTLWNGSSKRLLVSMLFPLATGGFFCLAMLYYGFIWLVFPATLLFYGLALTNASRFTYREVLYLGISDIVIGCIALFLTRYSLLFWTIGFGVLHIFYGLTMHNRYDREKISVPKKGIGTMAILIFLLISFQGSAQVEADSAASRTRKWYDKETIYMRGGNSFVKNNVLYSGPRALGREFAVSQEGMGLYLRSRRTRNIGLVISLVGSAGSIISLVSGNRDNFKKFFWVSLGTGVVSSVLTMQANNMRDQAVWIRNRDALLFMEANQ